MRQLKNIYGDVIDDETEAGCNHGMPPTKGEYMEDKVADIAENLPVTRIEFTVTSKAPMSIGGHASRSVLRGPDAATLAVATAKQRIKEGYSDVQIHEQQIVALSLSQLSYTEKLKYAKQISAEMSKLYAVDKDINLWTVEDVDWYLANYGHSYIYIDFID